MFPHTKVGCGLFKSLKVSNIERFHEKYCDKDCQSWNFLFQVACLIYFCNFLAESWFINVMALNYFNLRFFLLLLYFPALNSRPSTSFCTKLWCYRQESDCVALILCFLCVMDSVQGTQKISSSARSRTCCCWNLSSVLSLQAGC